MCEVWVVSKPQKTKIIKHKFPNKNLIYGDKLAGVINT